MIVFIHLNDQLNEQGDAGTVYESMREAMNILESFEEYIPKLLRQVSLHPYGLRPSSLNIQTFSNMMKNDTDNVYENM